MTDKSIITECYVDTNLIETLIPTKIGYNKQHGCSKVVNVMKKYGENFALGIIDKDKKDLDYLKEFEKIDEEKEQLILWQHKIKKHQYIIQIAPEVEPWLIKLVSNLELKFSDYGLPEDLNGLYKYAKRQSSKNDYKLKQLFSVISKTDHIVVKKLKHWVSYLKENNYKADIQELKNV